MSHEKDSDILAEAPSASPLALKGGGLQRAEAQMVSKGVDVDAEAQRINP